MSFFFDVFFFFQKKKKQLGISAHHVHHMSLSSGNAQSVTLAVSFVRFFSPCNGLIRKGATRLTLSSGEQRTARCLSTYQSHSVTVAAGEGDG